MPGSPAGGSRKRASYTALTYLLLFGFAIAVPLLLVLGALLFQSASTQREQLESRISQVLSSLVNVLDRDLDRHLTILNTLATSEALASGNWRAFYDQAKAGLQGRTYLVLVDAEDGRQLVNTYVPFGEQPEFTGDPETVRRMAETKAPIVSNLFESLVVKKPVLNVSIPILRDGELAYVMSLGLLPERLLALLAAQRLGPEWLTLIWDERGIILARSRDQARFLGTPVPANIRGNERPAIVRTTNLDGTDVLHATGRSRLSGWGVGVNVPYSLITEQMNTSLLLSGLAAVLAVAIAIGVGLLFARQITSSLSLATKAAAAFGRGEPFPIAGSRLVEADAFLATLRNAQDEQFKAQGHQKLLVRELQHRTQNLLSVVQSIINRSLNDGQEVAHARQVISGRLQALARAHAILAGTAWEGAPLREILNRELGEEFPESVEIEDCDIVVSAGAAHQFALIVHELTTNALKYGALSVPSGRVKVTGRIDETDGTPQFSLLWRESGGPPVEEPKRKGFGSVILFEAAKQFGMEIKASYEPEGLSYELRVPMHEIAPAKPSDSTATE